MNKQLQKNLHLIFLVFGILFGFIIFAHAAVVDPLAGMLAYFLFYLPAFFGGVYSGEDRAEDSDFLDVMTEMVNNIFKLDLDNDILNMRMRVPLNQICAITLTIFYFAFWMILGIFFGLPVIGHFIKWLIPSYLFGLLSNKDTIEFIKPLVQKFIRKL